MSKVAVSPDVLKWARERARLDVDDLATKFPKYEDWEEGSEQPSLRQLENLARATSTPFGYFFLPEPPDEELHIPDFRTIRDKPIGRPSPDLIETVQTMELRQQWMHEYLDGAGHNPLAFIGSAKLKNDPDLVAAKMRKEIGLSSGWAEALNTWDEARGLLRKFIEDAGVLVVINGVVGNNTSRALDPQEFRGFVLTDLLAPVIFVNGADAKAAQMFTMAHELAHLWLGKSALFDLPHLLPGDDATEKFCNEAAAEFLVPKAELASAWDEAQNQRKPFSFLAQKFKVSPIVVARRALDLKLISKKAFFEFYDAHIAEVQASKEGKKASGGDFWKTQTYRVGSRFAQAVIAAAKEGKLLYRDAYALTGLRGKTFDDYAKKLGY